MKHPFFDLCQKFITCVDSFEQKLWLKNMQLVGYVFRKPSVNRKSVYTAAPSKGMIRNSRLRAPENTLSLPSFLAWPESPRFLGISEVWIPDHAGSDRAS
jgi:hypothetical protein